MSCIYLLAGTNGAGKSSVAGARFADRRFDPDVVAAQLRQADGHISAEAAAGEAWKLGVRLLERAIEERLDFTLETTLGGDTIWQLLERAARDGVEIRMIYVGLETVEHHIARVRARVARGGHDIPEERIRIRFDRSRINLIRLLPVLTELRLMDNTADADPADGKIPLPKILLHLVGGEVVEMIPADEIPAWAKPILASVFF